MLSNLTPSKVIFGALLVFVICVIVLVVLDKIKNKQKKDEQPQNPINENTDEIFGSDCVMDKMRVTVVDQFCRVEMVGIRSPKSVEIFTVVFEDDFGKVIKLDVPKEMYDGIDKEQRGVLTIVNGELYSFELL